MLYPAVLALHLLGAFAFFTGNVGGVLITAHARREPLPAAVLSLMRAHERAIFALVIPGSIVALLTGLWLAHMIKTEILSTWIAGSLGLWLLSLAIGVGVLLKPANRAVAEARRLMDQGETTKTAELIDAVGGTRVVVGEWAQVAIVVALVVLMALKPA